MTRYILIVCLGLVAVAVTWAAIFMTLAFLGWIICMLVSYGWNLAANLLEQLFH